MPQTIRLYPQDDGGLMISGPSGKGIYLPQYRLRVWVKVGAEYTRRQAVLDTGSPTCIFSKQVWVPLHDRGEIEWLSHPPSADISFALLPRTTFLFGTYPFRLGRVLLQPVDLESGSLNPLPLLVQCTEDEDDALAPLPRIFILGLAGLLNGRTLTLSASSDGKDWQGTLSE